MASVILSSNNVPRALSSKWRSGLGPGGDMSRWHFRHAQTPQLCLCVQLKRQLCNYSWQDTLTYTEDFQLSHVFPCIPQHEGQIPNLGPADSMHKRLEEFQKKKAFGFKPEIHHFEMVFFFFIFKFFKFPCLHVGSSCWWESLQPWWWLLPSAGCPFCLTPSRLCRWSGGFFPWLEVCLRYRHRTFLY